MLSQQMNATSVSTYVPHLNISSLICILKEYICLLDISVKRHLLVKLLTCKFACEYLLSTEKKVKSKQPELISEWL